MPELCFWTETIALTNPIFIRYSQWICTLLVPCFLAKNVITETRMFCVFLLKLDKKSAFFIN
jgi:hypothetical protein